MWCMTSLNMLPIIGSMSITPLYSAAELDAEIAQAKIDLASARKTLSYQVDTGSSSRRAQRDQVTNLQNHLVWLQTQRAALEIGPGPQAIIGRPAR